MKTVTEMIAKIHDDIEGRYDLDSYDKGIIHSMLCDLARFKPELNSISEEKHSIRCASMVSDALIKRGAVRGECNCKVKSEEKEEKSESQDIPQSLDFENIRLKTKVSELQDLLRTINTAIQHSNMKNTVLHDQIRAAIKD